MISEYHRKHILKKDVWHEFEIKAVLNADSSIYDLLRASITAKTLTPICTVQIAADGASVYGFIATEVIEWARLKGFSIPAEVAALVNIKPIESESEAEAKPNFDDELDSILDAGLRDAFNESKQRDEAPYDGVLGCPPDSVTAEEKERFVSIRNRLLDREGLTGADIIGLINDCDANTHSFSLIPDRLKQDIRFLASLWRAAKKDKPKAEAIGTYGACKSFLSEVINPSTDTYTQRKISFSSWLESSGIDIEPLTKNAIFQQIQLGCKNSDKRLWSIQFSTFDRDFWQPYSEEEGIKKKRGRPAKKI